VHAAPGLALLVAVAAVGLAHLAVHGSVTDHRLGVAMIVLVATAMIAMSPFASALLLLVSAMSVRLRPTVPARVPREWTGR
jgi:hypothetical protein